MVKLDIESRLKTPLLRVFLTLMIPLMVVVATRDVLAGHWTAVTIDLLVLALAGTSLLFFRRLGFARAAVASAYGFTLAELGSLILLGYHSEDSFFLVVDVLILLLLFTTVFVQDLKHVAGVIVLESVFLVYHITQALVFGRVTTESISLSQQLFGPVTTFVLVAVMALMIRLYSNRSNREYREIAVEREQKHRSLGLLIRGLSHHLNTPLGNSKMALSLQADQEAVCLDPDVQRLLTTAVDTSIAVVGRLGEFMAQTEHAQLTTLEAGSLAGFFAQQQTQPIAVEESEAVQKAAAGAWQHYWGPISFVVAELVDNARLHGNPGGQFPRVSLDLNASHELVIEVRNQGPLIPADLLSKVREPFFSTLVSPEHPGLGLYFASYIGEHLLGGELELESGQETTVTLRIPAVLGFDRH